VAEQLTAFARNLRTQSTNAERLFWSKVRSHRLAGHKFKRQQPIGYYVVDFVCFESHLVVELDGGQHAANRHDAVRDAWLCSKGFRVLRFWNSEVLGNIEGVLEVVLAELKSAPSP
jgi:very-short-patch-repair endonuclease